MAATRAAQVDFFVRTMPQGYDTRVANDAESISQGQRQLLTIARVRLNNPAILILDEATSSIDTRTELQVQAAFDELMAGRTSFVVAHRLSTIRNADCILVMRDGEIIERGTHDELLATCDEYRSIYESQTKNQAQPEELAAAEQGAESSTAEPSETVTVTVTMPTADTSAADANAADTKEGEAR